MQLELGLRCLLTLCGQTLPVAAQVWPGAMHCEEQFGWHKIRVFS